jgi:hypothetical protein
MVKPWMDGRSLGLGASRLKRTDDGFQARSADRLWRLLNENARRSQNLGAKRSQDLSLG